MQKLCLQSNSRQDVFGFAVGCKTVVVRYELYKSCCDKVNEKRPWHPPPPTATRAEAYAGGLCAAATVSFLRGPVSPRPPAS
jgi:hypothetical protein